MLLSAPATLLLRNIIVATDFSPASELALNYARAIARHYAANIVLVHAMVPVEKAPSEQEVQETAGILADAEIRLRAEADRCGDVECHTRLVRGTALEVVEQILSIDHVDLIVVGTHRRAGIRRLLLGSAAEQIFRHVRCPVLVVGPSVAAIDDVWEPKRILLATDLESAESKTIECATALAAEYRADLALLHVTPGGSSALPGGHGGFSAAVFSIKAAESPPFLAGP